MSTAPNISALKARLDRYFWENTSPEMVYFREVLKNRFTPLGGVAVIGGLVRDFAREGRSGFKSDVDLVVDAPADEVRSLAESLRAASNRFGGFGYRSGPWKIDFWALEKTWARQHVSIESFSDLPSCTFFDWDAVAYDIKSKKIISSKNYLNAIVSNTIEINLKPNPSPRGNLLRAVRRLALWKVRPGPQLREFIKESLDDDALLFIKNKEKALYVNPVSCRWNNAESALSALLDEEKSQEILQYRFLFNQRE
ncbi:hypothetical protein [Thalassobaculum litoreum]|uniref:Poly A polymerase head domain-containing protein n=1 Tax=Thalassobaculum litoreum DSM 18839 TaxID=1123362 RepID=A0A8G2BFE1_9PROT|nr:hypothetical protein [Thalassobaculum litoreum]SDF38018.1 hypothetical protein SAMN05660686_01087 [Thalassobaculum litoreum DSM 18839]